MEEKIAVIYESRYGHTRRYAEWIAQALSCPVFCRKAFHPRDFAQYETIIYGGGLYAGGVSGIRLLTANRELLRGKRVIVFTCGIADPADADNAAGIRSSLAKALSPEMLEQTSLFHLRGGMDYARLSPVHRAMMSMLRRMLSKKPASSLREEDRQLLQTYGTCIDFTDPESIRPLVACAASRDTDGPRW